MVMVDETLLVRKTQPTILSHVELLTDECCWWKLFLYGCYTGSNDFKGMKR